VLHHIRLAAAIALGLKTPFAVTHHVTYRCNLDCDMCFSKMMPPVTELSTDACVALQKDFRKRGTMAWGYSGGEALVREDMDHLLASAKSLGMRTFLHTNGILLPQRPEIKSSIDALEIGIDGGRGSHEALRGGGSFDKAVAGLESFVRTEPVRPRVTILTILNNLSIEPGQLDEMLRLAVEYGARVSFTLAAAHRADDRVMNNARRHNPGSEQFEEFREWLEREKAGPKGHALADDPSYFRSLGGYPDNARPVPCQAGSRRCVLDPAGLALPCADLFDHSVAYLPRGKRFGYGYAGFASLPKAYPCGKQYCYTSKTNYILGNPRRLFNHYLSR
jgi:pyrroloquinoline quinone biosynthesis protein E